MTKPPPGRSSMAAVVKSMSRDIRSHRDGMSDALADAFAEEGLKMGIQMQQYINTRPSEKSGKTGRVETGDMRDSVSVEEHRGKTRTRVNVGYIIKPRWYMVYQEKGFEHHISNEWIKGTFAMADSYRNMRVRLNRKIRKLGFRSTKY